MRRELFPALVEIYPQWLKDKKLSALKRLVEQSEKHWLPMAQNILSLFNDKGLAALPDIEKLVQKNFL